MKKKKKNYVGLTIVLSILCVPLTILNAATIEYRNAILDSLFRSDTPEAGYVDLKETPEATKKPEPTPEPTPHLIEPGEVFTRNSYIEVAEVQILYNGEEFEITNSRSGEIIITAAVVGVKADGSYQAFYYPAFGGIDETAYKKDLEENGWAIKTRTNRVRPGETLTAKMEIYDFAWDEDFPAPDVDGDGYYDIMFTIHPQRSEDSFQVSTADPESGIYKLKA